MVHIAEIPLPPVASVAPDPPTATAPDPPPSASVAPNPRLTEPLKPPYSASAVRVANIMRNYLHNGAAASGSADARCRAMMEVVRNEHGRWLVSRIELEHCHQLASPPDPAAGRLLPAVGMLFDSVSIAKAFYYTYSEKMGFKARTGSGRRSRDNRMLIMQRFLCCRGNPQPVKSKRGPARLPPKEVAAAGAVEEGDTMEAMQLESGEHEREVESGLPEISAKIPIPKTAIPRHLSPRAQDDAEMVKDGGKVPLVLNPGQSRLLRELGIRVSRYTQEERRDIILKYMQKRNSRQVVDRSIKVPSRQALAGRRQRGFGGKFLSKEEMEDASASTLQQPFHDHAHMSQNVVQGFPSLDLHTLQFVGNNPPLDPQSEDQTHCAIPTWDFL